jgi:hypothetical protein
MKSSAPLNASALADYNQQLNEHANVRDYLMTFPTNLAITTSDSIKLQASTLAQLTGATNQLTRTASVNTNYFLWTSISTMYDDIDACIG